MKRGYDPGPDCRICGTKAINVVHDDEAERSRNIAVWAFPTPGQNNQDYYTWAGVVYHEFAPATPDRRPPSQVRPSNPRETRQSDDYLRGYQAGYHAKARESKP